MFTVNSPAKSSANFQRRFGPAAVLAVALCFFCSDALAAATPHHFVITVLKVELKNNTGEWITVIEPDLRVDLVEKDPSVSYLNNAGRIPSGNYINFRITISESVKVTGTDHGNKTRAGGELEIGGNARHTNELPGKITAFKELAPTWTEAAEEVEGPVRIHFNFDDQDADQIMEITRKRDFPEPIEVKKNSFIYVWFAFNLEGILSFAEYGMLGPGIPETAAMVSAFPSKIEVLLSVDKQEFSSSSVGAMADLILSF